MANCSPSQPTRKPRPFRAALTLASAAALLAACAQPQAPGQAPPGTVALDPEAAHAPPFAQVPFQRFSRADAVAIALREWRAWGQLVDDDPPDSRPPPPPDEKPERVAGFWQRVGEYWWLGMNADSPMAGWTGKHDSDGRVFAAKRDANYAWSAAFISYVMRSAGAGSRFPYSPAHSTYINIAREMSMEQPGNWAVTAMAPESAAPVQGDIICTARAGAHPLKFSDLPLSAFNSHCDLVVAVAPGSLTVIGGNVDDAVTMKHVPTTPDGKLAAADGTPVDFRYAWFVVLRVLYDQ